MDTTTNATSTTAASKVTSEGLAAAARADLAQRPARTRLSRKRRFRVVPPMPLPVRGLWEAASEEQRKAAHRTCSVVLQRWLGKTSRAQAAAELSVTPLRMWQLGQQALAGMVAGLLRQPRTRARIGKEGGILAMATGAAGPREELARLRKENAQLERRLKIAEDVIALLRELPANRASRTDQATAARDGTSGSGSGKATAREASATSASGEETRSVPEHVVKRRRTSSGTRRSTPDRSASASEGVADGTAADPTR